MQKGFSLITGVAKIRITGRKPERALNRLTEEDIKFKSLKRISEDTIELAIRGMNYPAAEALCRRAGFEITLLSKSGVPFFLRRFKKRYVLFFAPIISIVAAFYLSFFIWELEVTGNETVSKGEILAALEEAGVGIGTFGPGIDQEITRSLVLGDINKLSWLTVKLSGCRAQVVVRERTDRPEIIDEDMPTEVRSGKTGIIEKMNVYMGKPLVKAGDTVVLGQTIITGALDSRSSGMRYVHAMGDVYARTWYEISASIPLEYTAKKYTGRNIEKKSVILGNIRLNLYFNAGISMASYDKITVTERLEIGGFHLPVSIEKSVYREYEPILCRTDAAYAEAVLKNRLLTRLDDIKDDGEIRMTRYEISNENGVLTVTLSAECLEQIGVVSPLQIPAV